jgi:DNA primase
MITRTLLRAIRNDLPMPYTIRQMGDQAPAAKHAEGRFRFLCPHCGEMLAVVNPRNNLAHCFACGKNTNNIDLMLENGYAFRKAVDVLHRWLKKYQQEKNQRTQKRLWEPTRPPPSNDGPARLGEILLQRAKP